MIEVWSYEGEELSPTAGFFINSIEKKACGFTAVTIGVDETEEDNIRLYKRLGFNKKVNDCFEDPCDVVINMKPKACECFWLLKKELGEEL